MAETTTISGPGNVNTTSLTFPSDKELFYQNMGEGAKALSLLQGNTLYQVHPYSGGEFPAGFDYKGQTIGSYINTASDQFAKMAGLDTSKIGTPNDLYAYYESKGIPFGYNAASGARYPNLQTVSLTPQEFLQKFGVPKVFGQQQVIQTPNPTAPAYTPNAGLGTGGTIAGQQLPPSTATQTQPIYNSQTGQWTLNGQPTAAPPSQNFSAGLAAAQASGKEAPQEAGAARTAVTDYTPANSVNAPTTTPNVDNFFASNPNVTASTKDLMDFLSPPAITQQINDQIKTLNTDKAVLTGLDTQYMNIQNVMSGTENDIRQEITKARGFATNSQVMALTAARNKTLLLQAKSIQQQIATQRAIVANDTSLLAEEKSMANTQFTQRMDILKYEQQNNKNIENANRETYNNIIKAKGGGYALLYAVAATAGSEYISYVEDTLGLPPGGLLTAASGENIQTKQIGQTNETISTYETGTDGKTYKVTTKGGVETSRVEQKATKTTKTAKGKFNTGLPYNDIITHMQNRFHVGNDGGVDPTEWNTNLQLWLDYGASLPAKQQSKYTQQTFIKNFGYLAKNSAANYNPNVGPQGNGHPLSAYRGM